METGLLLADEPVTPVEEDEEEDVAGLCLSTQTTSQLLISRLAGFPAHGEGHLRSIDLGALVPEATLVRRPARQIPHVDEASLLLGGVLLGAEVLDADFGAVFGERDVALGHVALATLGQLDGEDVHL